MTKATLITASGLSPKRCGMPRMRFAVYIGTAIPVILSLFLFSFKAAETLREELWKQLGISQEQGSERIKNGFLYGYIDYGGTRNLHNLTWGDKAAIAKDLVIYTKNYLNGPAFKAAYAKERAASKPENISFVPVTKEGIKKERIDELKKNIKELEESVKKMPALEKDARKAIAGYEKAIKDYESPDSKMLNVFYETALNQQQHTRQQYDKRMKKWETNYPQDHRDKIRKYLEDYLATAATVDFDAALTEKNGKKIFVNKEYESRNADWKRIYRGGREVYNAMKPLAEQWLKEIK
ncbi:MAG TPA: hypothetical protein PKE30_10900 [Niabella sp.]|nr:hypothetical protein [Niabella sp.]